MNWRRQKFCSVYLIDWEGNRYASGDMYFYAYENLQVMFQYMSLEARKLSMLIAPARSSSSFGIVHHHQEIVEEAIFSQAEIPRLIWEFSSSLEFWANTSKLSWSRSFRHAVGMPFHAPIVGWGKPPTHNYTDVAVLRSHKSNSHRRPIEVPKSDKRDPHAFKNL